MGYTMCLSVHVCVSVVLERMGSVFEFICLLNCEWCYQSVERGTVFFSINLGGGCAQISLHLGYSICPTFLFVGPNSLQQWIHSTA